MQACVPSTSGESETAAGPPSPVADSPSALPAPTSFHSFSQELFLPVRGMPAPICPAVVLYCSTFQGYKAVRFKMFIFVCLFFRYYLCEKCYKPTTAQ